MELTLELPSPVSFDAVSDEPSGDGVSSASIALSLLLEDGLRDDLALLEASSPSGELMSMSIRSKTLERSVQVLDPGLWSWPRPSDPILRLSLSMLCAAL